MRFYTLPHGFQWGFDCYAIMEFNLDAESSERSTPLRRRSMCSQSLRRYEDGSEMSAPSAVFRLTDRGQPSWGRRLLAVPLGHRPKGAWRLGLRLRSLLIGALEHDKERRQGFLFKIVFGEACRSRRAPV